MIQAAKFASVLMFALLISACAGGARNSSQAIAAAEQTPGDRFPQPMLRVRLPATLVDRPIRAYVYKGSSEIAHSENANVGSNLVAWTDGVAAMTDLILHPGPGQYRVAIWIANPSGLFRGSDSWGATRSIEISDSTEIAFDAKDLLPLVAVQISISGHDDASCEWLPNGEELGPSEPFLLKGNVSFNSRFGLIDSSYDVVCWSGPSLMQARWVGIKRHIVVRGPKTRVHITPTLLHSFFIDGAEPFKLGDEWEFGFSVTPSLKADAFRVSKFVDDHEALHMWHPGSGSQGYYPYVAVNRMSDTAKVFGGVVVRPKQLAMEGANDGRFSIVRFIAPTTGTYWLETRVEGIHVGPSTTDIHVLFGDRSLFDAWIEGYGGDSRFHAIEGSCPSARYSTLLDLHRGEAVSFALGYGFNRTHFGDTTGVTPELRLLSTRKF